PPVRFRLCPFQQLLLELRQIEVEMLGLAAFQRRLGIEPRVRIDQILWLQEPTAVFALVPARPWVLTVWALALDVGVGKEPLCYWIVEAYRPLLVQKLLVEQHHELVLDELAVIVGGGGRVQVVANHEIAAVGQEVWLVARAGDSRGGPLLACRPS